MLIVTQPKSLPVVQVPLMLYKEAMKGVRKHLVRHIYDGRDEMSFVSEATADQATGVVFPANDRFEHLTCFAGGMFVLGECRTKGSQPLSALQGLQPRDS